MVVSKSKHFIHLVWGEGKGRTSKSAFDAALADAGLHNFNLIELSSVIPPRSEVIEVKRFQSQTAEQIGDRVYGVLSVAISPPNSSEVWAGLGWTYTVEYGGILVEVQGSSKNETEEYLCISLEDMARYRPYLHSAPKQFKVIRASSTKSEYACALIAAIYQIVSW